MALLKVARQEAYCRFRAQGLSQAQSALRAGYSETHASSTACHLEKRPEVKARIVELTTRVDQAVAMTGAITKDWVFEGIRITMEQARAKGKFAEVMKGYDLIGRHLKLWERAAEEVPWDGDLSTLSDDQLANLAKSLEKFVDPAVVAAAKRRLMLESGEVMDVEPTPAIPATLQEEKKENW